VIAKGGVWAVILMMLGACLGGTASASARRSEGERGERSSTAASSPAVATNAAIQKVFDLRGLSADKRDIAKHALASHDFDWTLLLPALRANDHRKRIPITVTDASEWGAVGLAWPAPVGKVEVDDDVLDPLWFRDVVLHEVGHMVDFYYLEPYGLRDDVAEIYGAPWDEMGHSFNNAFTQAFSSYTVVDSTFPLGDTQIDELRALMGFEGSAPAKTGTLTDVREFDLDFTAAEPIRHDDVHANSPIVPVA
jgi:hypothetical protein